MTATGDHAWMSRALKLARLGLYTTDPNPLVGCVIVKDDALVAEGWHQKAGDPHAEKIALAAAGEEARGATLYVTLEPCCHHGKTPPCSDVVIKAGVARVVIAMQDPNPLVAGKGVSQLQDAGIEVECGVLEQQARELNPGFVSRMERGRPWVRCKLAMSVDGRTAMANGESKWITSDASRKDVHRLRARSSAVVTGIGTLLADDPSLNVRLNDEELSGVTLDAPLTLPLRVIMDADLRTPPDARVLQLEGDTLIVTASTDSERSRALADTGTELLVIDRESGHLDWQHLLRELTERQINDVLIEAGATIAGSALRAGIIDELVLYMAPHLMGDDARGLVHLPGLDTMEQRIELQLTDLRQLGNDMRMTYRIKEAD
ncbi:bifunctional diaminohydroxyphosphoribosylaminopyrimidine deaminase/5-amino-6-(5-phosphoribosylamino)uracil reductase RibD [Solemya velum gill symbiont]|uniref:Riboflavin biosynthesis protein RibD n=2 Tax=Solemya velum gill symbiont TaxID=2340 RepID=A0A0B0HCZ6_SOVGS|nr:bifunctional diaminohydroxyphosphoribosylaminopyrimidine deaminase/5-amino-6-(5-phosphoribosylamino)uracil reductase RibD [Solemya velum gill symbiont]KHF25331.1 diaminohydroxyphosphoribosylaminopyrimidine deaminase [Solemya velum gill symbiont]